MKKLENQMFFWLYRGKIITCPNAAKLIASIKTHDTSAEDAGRIAKAANGKTLILNHFGPPDDRSLTDKIWVDAVKSTYRSNIIIEKDLLQLAL
ncbi:MAG: hypothetical protein IPL46_05015 [Saprospiraceae bacterium]|nr:hypothetical protein [Saprospiraceae bacterium]